MKIGVGITTYHRLFIDDYSIEQWEKYSPNDFELIVVKDIEGVAKAKNWCLQLLEEAGVTDFFLADDDCWPISKDWWKPYIQCGEPHLMYQFKVPGKPANDMRLLYKDDKITSWSHTRGAFIYVHRTVLDVVGGLDTAYGLAYYEHPDWTNRIHNAGLTTHRAMDVVNSDKLLYCLDQDGKAPSSIPASHKGNHMLYRKSRTSKEFKPYK